MSIGKKFLERVLTEAKDVDGFKDNFDITTIPATSPALANLSMPMARQVVQLYHLMGVSLETLEMRPKAVRDAAMTIADELRTNRPLRLAAQRLFTALATAKGFARKEKEEGVMEAADVMKNTVDVNLIGSRVVRQIESVLAALKLPSGVLSRAMKRDAQSLMDTAALIQKGAVRSKFMLLASELGVNLNDVGSEVEVKEAVDPMGADMYADAVMALVAELGVPDEAFARNARTVLAAKFRDLRGEQSVGALLPLVKRFTSQLQAAKSRTSKGTV